MSKDIEYILDASVLLNFLNNKKEVVNRIMEIDTSRAYITPITVAELHYGMLIKARSVSSTDLNVLLEEYGVVPLNTEVAIRFAKLRESGKITDCIEIIEI